jgi:hypothetical protein
MEAVAAFLDPVLGSAPVGTWDPATLTLEMKNLLGESKLT